MKHLSKKIGPQLLTSAVISTPEQRRERLPQGPFTVPDYIAERVDEQVNNFYRRRASEYQARITRLRTIILTLGVIAAVLERSARADGLLAGPP